MVNTPPPPNSANAYVTVIDMIAIMNWLIAQKLGPAVAELKKGNEIFKGEICRQVKKIKRSNRRFQVRMEASLEKTRTEIKADNIALRTEMKADNIALRAEIKADVREQIKDLKQNMLWMMGTTVVLVISVNFLPPLFINSANPGIGQVEQINNQHAQTKKELVQLQGQLTQVIEYLQASAEPGRPAPALLATQTGDGLDTQPAPAAVTTHTTQAGDEPEDQATE